MAKNIEILMELQAKDNELDSITARIAAIPEEIGAGKKEIDALNESLKAADGDYKKQAVAQQDLENDIRKFNEEIKKSQSELYVVKTNELYATILDGIKNKKAQVSETETALLEVMEKVDAEKQRLAELKEQNAKQSAEINARTQALNAEKDALSAEFNSKKAARDESAESMKSDIALVKALEQYERIRKSKGGLGVVKVKEGNACSGCNIALTRQQIIEVTSSDIVICENCGRMLCA